MQIQIGLDAPTVWLKLALDCSALKAGLEYYNLCILFQAFLNLESSNVEVLIWIRISEEIAQT